MSRVLQSAIALVVLQLVVRGVVAGHSDFYWDDLILAGRGSELPLLSADLLLYDHDGHFMPAAFVVAGIATRIAPYDWALPLVMLVVLQALASLAVLRLLRALLGDRRVLLIPLTFYLFTPLTIPAFTWWAAGLNALPLQIGLAWVTADAIALRRTGRRRFAVSGALVFAVCLLFFEKSVLIPFVAFATVALLSHVSGSPSPLKTAWRRGRALWTTSIAIVAVWALAYATTVSSQFEWAGMGRAWELFSHATSLGLFPTLLGGPWVWERWVPSPPWSSPPVVLVVAGWLTAVAAVAATMRWKRRVGWVWIAAGAYFLASVTAMVITRWGADTTFELAQTLRYFTDTASIVTIAMALVLRAPNRVPLLSRVPANRTKIIAVAATVAFAFSSVYSTYTFTRSWEENPTTDYLATARASLAEHDDVPLLEQPTSIWVLLPVAYPNNLVSRVLGPLNDRPEFSDSTPELRMLDDSGQVVDADVTWVRAITQGIAPDCGNLVERRSYTDIPLDGPLTNWEWTVQLNYLASANGAIEIAMENGKAAEVPVTAGPNRVFVRLTGGGDNLRIRTLTPDLSLCVGMGPVGVVIPKP
ncbi:hypothetical protein [Rhodococcus sp. NPDC058521]|uniref:hypothetical protein n=1 Tax=Rhodococcus sp. NPDC058521 TaxID=3346536 RepID=UPI0036512E8A